MNRDSHRAGLGRSVMTALVRRWMRAEHQPVGDGRDQRAPVGVMNQARILTTSLGLVLMVGACRGQLVASPSVASAPSTVEATGSAAVTPNSPAGAATPAATIDLAAVSGRIVFSNYDDVWIDNADGTDLRRLTLSPWQEFDPSLSPDGRLIAYRSEPNDYPELWLMNADGSGQHRLTEDGGFPAWSSDGSMIAYAPGGGASGKSGIAIMNPDGSGQRRLPGTDYGELPSWSGDGKRICFSNNLSGRGLM